MELSQHLLPSGATVVEALNALNALSGDAMTLFVTDVDGKLIGSITDGDIRRALLSGRGLGDAIEDICRRDCLTLARGADDTEVIAVARERGIRLLPVIEGGKIAALIDLKHTKGLIPADAVLMAGGKGERLRPLTATVPKPLLPVGGRPIIDYNVDLLRRYGIDRIFVTVNYLKEQIIDHFGDAHPAVKCVAETRGLGTAGSLSLIEEFGSPHIILMNADLLTDINLEEMYLRHLRTGAMLTMGVVPYTVSVPYAIVEHKGDKVKGLTEKPTYNYYANAGIYMMRREVAGRIPHGSHMDATDLVESLIADGETVTMYPLTGRWIDIGSPDDYRHACELLKS